MSIALFVAGWSCVPGGEGWRQTHFGDGLGLSVGEARCWVIRFEDVSVPEEGWVDTVMHASGARRADQALPWLLRAGDRGTYVGPADSVWKAFSGRPGDDPVRVQFEVVHVCGPDRPDVDGALAAFAQPERPWKRCGLASWCAPAGGEHRPWRIEEAVQLTTTVRSWPDREPTAHRAVQTWNWGDEDQLLPGVHRFLSDHPGGGMVVGPAWDVFGPGGLPAAGWTPETTVVLELAVERPELGADYEDAGAFLERRDR